MTSHDIQKALEIWSLQSLLDTSIMLGVIALGLAIVQQYYKSLEEYLTLRVSVEVWNLVVTILVDILLAIVMVIGLLVFNLDIMADIKMAIPFTPIAIILFVIALFLRLFYGGHKPSNPNFLRSIWVLFVANIINIIGFTFVMEPPGSEYFGDHSSAFWTFINTHLKSNADPHGLALSKLAFYIFYPILIIVLIWGFASAVKILKNKGE